jgi:hypothetical protein
MLSQSLKMSAYMYHQLELLSQLDNWLEPASLLVLARHMWLSALCMLAQLGTELGLAVCKPLLAVVHMSP